MHDALGSTIALTDSSGNIATEYFYDPFGKTQASNPNIYNPFQYTGRENDGNGHYGYRLRTLSTELHRFISQDPIGLLSGDINFYSYVSNQPTAYIDPYGLWTFSVGVNLGGWLGAIGGGGGTAINIGYSKCEGFSASITGSVGGGAITGVGAGVGLTFSGTNAQSVNQLLGATLELSRGLGPVTLTGLKGKGDSYTGGAVTVGIGGKTIVASQGAGTFTSTSAIIQFQQKKGLSLFVSGGE